MGVTKDKVFSTPVPDNETLRAKMSDTILAVTREMLEKTRQDIEYLLGVLLVSGESTFLSARV